MYDVIIIGMGPAGLGAAVYAKRSGLNVLLLEKSAPGGLINKTNVVENYLGYKSISGPDLAYKMFEHINNLNIPYKIETVKSIREEEKIKKVYTNNSVYETKAVIICGGRSPRKTNLENEEKLMGKGLSYCAVCDAPLYKNKTVAVIGGGNSAFEEGLYLADFVKKLYILVRSENVRADKSLQEEIEKRKNVEVLLNTKVSEIITEDEKIKEIILNDSDKLEVDGVFVYIGYVPETGYLNELNITNDEGYIEVNNNCETKISGIFAAGDIIKKDLYQIITASSEGATAAISAKKYIKSLEN